MLKANRIHGASSVFEAGTKFVVIKNCIIYTKLRWIRRFRGGQISRSANIFCASSNSGGVNINNIRDGGTGTDFQFRLKEIINIASIGRIMKIMGICGIIIGVGDKAGSKDMS